MEGLRFALLIAGLAIVVGIVLYAWLSRGRRSRRADGLGTLDGDSYLENADFYDPVVPDDVRVVTPDPPVDDLGGVFTPRRETSGAEISVDVGVLAGLRATYESTVGGDPIAAEVSADDAVPQELEPAREAPDRAPEAPKRAREAHETAPDASEPAAEDLEPAPEGSDNARDDVDAGPAAEDAEPLVVDMTRPMVYLMLIAQEQSLSGATILESLHAEGFRPGAMQLYYWQSGSDPTVVFGVANLVEPGVLEPESLPDMETPGLVTFMSVPSNMSLALRTFNAMVEVSRHLALRIDAKVCDETQSTLTAQAENHLREKVGDILRRDRI